MRTSNPQKTFMGNPCARGHEGKRYRCNGACVDCTTENQEKRRREKLEAKPADPAEPSYGGTESDG